MTTPTRMSLKEKIRESRASQPPCSPMSNSPYCDSPTFTRRECRLGSRSVDISRTGRTRLGVSLSQAKMDQWSMSERVKILEAQLRDKEEVMHENAQLREELASSEKERVRTRERFVEMNDRLKGFISKEQSDRKAMEVELAEARERMRNAVNERDHTMQENAMLRRENELVQEEIVKIRQINADCIDRSVHDRILADTRRENDQLRASLTESVPKAIHERTVSQIAELNHLVSARTRELLNKEKEKASVDQRMKAADERDTANQKLIEKLRDELVDMERMNEGFSKKFVQVERQLARHIPIEDIEAMRLELVDSQKRVNQLMSELTVRAEKDKRISLETSILSQSIDMVRSEKVRLLKQVRALKEDTELVKLSVRNQRIEFNDVLRRQIFAIQAHFQGDINHLVNGIWNLLRQMSLVEAEWESPQTLTDAVTVLRSVVKSAVEDLRAAKEDCYIAKSHVAKLLAKCGEKDDAIRKLNAKLVAVDAGKMQHDSMLSKLRESVESAELRLSASRASRFG